MPPSLLSREDLIDRLREVFRRHGYEGASLSLISAATGLGKASLYHHFPGGKDAMVAAVLSAIEDWFEAAVFQPLGSDAPPRRRLQAMCGQLDDYFCGGTKICLPGILALGEERTIFAQPVRAYFQHWIDALGRCLADGGLPPDLARKRARAAVASIQGALVVARALEDEAVFRDLLADLPDSLLS